MTDVSLDPCVRLAKEHEQLDQDKMVKFLVRFTGLTRTTPRSLLVDAIAEEVQDLAGRALLALDQPQQGWHALPQATDARRLLDAARAQEERASICFPRRELADVEVKARPAAPALADEIARWVGKHEAFEARVRWLIGGTTDDEMAALDPIADCDRIHARVSSEFRVEARIIEMLTINRIAQSTAISLFFRGTKEAETNPIFRFNDTFNLYANFIEWGPDSKRGRAAIERMNQIHGRYYIPNDGMKYVLLVAPFTWLEGIERVGHRRLSEAEKQGFVHAYIKLGKAMNIQDLSFDYDEMRGWFKSVSWANIKHHPLKTDTFETIVRASLEEMPMPNAPAIIFLAARAAMDEAYRLAVGYSEVTAEELHAVRSVFFAAGALIQALPRTPFVRSIQHNVVRKGGGRPEELGVSDRSKHMPVANATLPNGGFPEWQRPIEKDADIVPMELPELPWDEIARHTALDSLWIVLDGFVYDVTSWAHHHPGGTKVLLAWAGKDATAAFARAEHSAATQIFKLNFRVGKVPAAQASGQVQPGQPVQLA